MKTIVILITLLISNILLFALLKEYGIELKGKWKKVNEAFIYILIFLMAQRLFWDNTQSIIDFIIVNIISLLYLIGYISIDKIQSFKNDNYIKFTISLFSAVIVFIVMNRYFIKPISHNIWIINLTVYWIRKIYDKENKSLNWDKKGLVYVLVHVFILVGVFNFIGEGFFYGTSRSMKKVKEYLIQKEGYTSSIDYIYNLKLEKGMPEPVVVNLGDGKSRYFEYINNRVKEIDLEKIKEYH